MREPTTCCGCGKRPEDLPEYVEMAQENGHASASQCVKEEEGTFNPKTGSFACTSCYVRMGAPSSPSGWKAP